mmetsp:Transcript_7942/g.10570  ORF Transcript_7942/g.10570 Transcript_7942/m.10570 type:complete len:202 (+) Transcript_7942:1324-1929(+)
MQLNTQICIHVTKVWLIQSLIEHQANHSIQHLTAGHSDLNQLFRQPLKLLPRHLIQDPAHILLGLIQLRSDPFLGGFPAVLRHLQGFNWASELRNAGLVASPTPTTSPTPTSLVKTSSTATTLLVPTPSAHLIWVGGSLGPPASLPVPGLVGSSLVMVLLPLVEAAFSSVIPATTLPSPGTETPSTTPIATGVRRHNLELR